MPPVRKGARPMKLLQAQEEVVWTLLRRLHAQADAVIPTSGNASVPAGAGKEPDPETDFERGSFNTYTISGTRGAGKTTALKVATSILPYLGRIADGEEGLRFEAILQAGKVNDELLWWALPEEVRKHLEPGAPRAAEDVTKAKDIVRLFSPHPNPGHGRIFGSTEMRTAMVLPLIDPTQFEHESRSVMEQVLAHLNHAIDQRLETTGRNGDGVGTPWILDGAKGEADPRTKKLRECKAALHGEIGRGWIFAQEFGQKMLADDSASFDEFVANRAALSVDAALRHKRWRKLVEDVLDCFNARLLVVCFDDCDLAPQHTADVMDAVRIYLGFKRIAVIFATDLGEMRHNLRVARLQSLKEATEVRAFTGRRADEKANSEMVAREFAQAELFLDKVIPVANRLHLHLTPYTEGAGLLEPGSDAPEFDDIDRELLRNGYGHIFSFLTARDVANIRRMVDGGDLRADVVELLSVSSALAEMAERYAALLTMRQPVRVRLVRGEEPFFWIAAAATPLSEDEDEEDDHGFEPDAELSFNHIWAIKKVPEQRVSAEHRFDQAEVLRGTYLAYEIDRRLALQGDRSAPVKIRFSGLPGERDLPPSYKADVARLISEPEALLADLEAFIDLPRNCRSLLAAVRVLAERPRSTASVRAKGYFVDSLLTDESLATLPEPRAGRLPFRKLFEKAIDRERPRQDLLFRILGVASVAIAGDASILRDGDNVREAIRAHLALLPMNKDELYKLTLDLSKALDESDSAMSLMSDAAAILSAKINVPWKPEDRGSVDRLQSLATDGWTVSMARFIDLVSRHAPEGSKRSRKAPEAAASQPVVDFLIACLGPMAILRYRFGLAESKPLAGAARTLWDRHLPGISREIMLPEAEKNPRRQRPASAQAPPAKRQQQRAREPDWSIFSGAPLADAAKFLAVPDELLRVVLEQL